MKRCVLSGLVVLCAGQAWASGYAQLNAGIVAHNRGDAEGTITFLTAAIQSPDLSPQFLAVAYFDRAEGFFRKGKYAEAVSDVSNALQRRPRWFDAHILRGAANEQLANFDAAVADYTDAIAIRPDLVGGYLARAQANSHAGKFAAALEDDNKALAIAPKSAAPYVARATVAEEQGRYDLALPDLKTGSDLAPKDARIRLGVGVAEWATGQEEQAVESFKDATDAAPKILYGWIWLAIAETAKGRAADEIERPASLENDGKAWPGPIAKLVWGKMAEKDVLEQASLGEPSAQPGQLCEADFYIGEWRLLHNEEAKAFFDDAMRVCPRNFIERYTASFELTRLARPKS